MFLCYACPTDFPRAERPTLKWIYPALDYRHAGVRKAVHLLKYKRKKQIAQVLGDLLYERIIEEVHDLEKMHNFTNPVYISIPLHWKKYKKRGFNQVDLLLRQIERNSTEKIKIKKRTLIKLRDTSNQARIKNRKERLENVVGSFVVRRPEKVKGRNIILLDDVATTGATLSEARKVLKEAGAKKVVAFTVAH